MSDLLRQPLHELISDAVRIQRWPMLTMFDSGDHGRIGWVVAASDFIAAGKKPWELSMRFNYARLVLRNARREARR